MPKSRSNSMTFSGTWAAENSGSEAYGPALPQTRGSGYAGTFCHTGAHRSSALPTFAAKRGFARCPVPTVKVQPMKSRKSSFRGGLGLKLVAPCAAVTALVSLVLVLLASAQSGRSLATSATSKGEAIALSLASAAEYSVFETKSTRLQATIDANKIID